MLRRTISYLVAGVLCGLTAPSATVVAQELPSASPAEMGFDAEKLGHITKIMQGLTDAGEIAGALTLVARRGHVVYFEALGSRDIAAGKAMQRDTILRIYSMSKPVTSVAVLMLYDQGLLKLDDPVSKYIPAWADLRVLVEDTPDGPRTAGLHRTMTIRDLLRHTAGLTYGFFGDTSVDRRYLKEKILDPESTLQDMVTKLSEMPLVHQPTEVWLYSISVDVLGYIVEQVSGQSFEAFLHKRLFAPLNMKDTGFHVPPAKINRFSANYGPDESGKLRVVDGTSDSRYATPAKLYSGGGGLVSTAQDYMHFCQMLLNDGALDGKRILKPSTVALMTSDHLPEHAFPIRFGDQRTEGVGFGLGVAVRVHETPDSAAPRGEYGWSGAASTHFWVSPHDELIVITMSQYMPYSHRLADAIKPVVYAALEQLPRAPQGSGKVTTGASAP